MMVGWPVGALAVGLALGTIAGPGVADAQTPGPVQPTRQAAAPAATAPFTSFVTALWPDAEAAGVRRATFDRALLGLTPDLTLPDIAWATSAQSVGPRVGTGQAEFSRTPEAYLDARQIAGLAAEGRRLAVEHAAALDAIERETGVDRAIVLAIWGRETSFGRWKATHDVVRSLATLAWTGRRPDVFRRELIYALKLLDDGLVRREDMRGSWAGAMGLTQFMPSEFYDTARALDGVRKPDLFRSVPDALASAANQLKVKGWKPGQPWGIEVRLPPDVTCRQEGLAQRKPLRAWLAAGVVPMAPGTAADGLLDEPAFLLMPAGRYGPAFLAFENFLVLKAYNFADLYALFVGSLADRIRSAPPFATRWAPVTMLSNAEIGQVQAGLQVRGYPIDKIDGKAGMATRSLIGAFQFDAGLSVDCWPSARVLKALNVR